jgi:hypothetical protein
LKGTTVSWHTGARAANSIRVPPKWNKDEAESTLYIGWGEQCAAMAEEQGIRSHREDVGKAVAAAAEKKIRLEDDEGQGGARRIKGGVGGDTETEATSCSTGFFSATRWRRAGRVAKNER